MIEAGRRCERCRIDEGLLIWLNTTSHHHRAYILFSFYLMSQPDGRLTFVGEDWQTAEVCDISSGCEQSLIIPQTDAMVSD